MKTCLTIVLCLCSIYASTQDLELQDNSIEQVSTEQIISLKFEIGMPLSPLSNQAYKKDFQGVLFTQISAHYKFFNQFTIGPFFNLSYFDNANNALNSTQEREIFTNQNIATGLSLGIEKIVGKKSMFNASLNLGYNWSRFNKINQQNSSKNQDYNLENYAAGLSFYYHYFIEGKFSVGPMFSYQYINQPYKPELISQNTLSSEQNTHLLFFGMILNLGF